MNTLQSLATQLDQAEAAATAIAPLHLKHALTLEEAYLIQQLTIAFRLARGERLVGAKMGFTSLAKMQQMGIGDQIIGWLTDHMEHRPDTALPLAPYIHARCEPELAFRLRHALPANINEAEAATAIDAVAPAIEIVDSRYQQFKFSLPDVIADNASAAGFVIGEWQACPANLADLAVNFSIDGETRQTGSTSDVLGNPLKALVAAARLAARTGTPLQAGMIILSGAATSAEVLTPGCKVQAEIAGLGRVGFFVTP